MIRNPISSNYTFIEFSALMKRMKVTKCYALSLLLRREVIYWNDQPSCLRRRRMRHGPSFLIIAWRSFPATFFCCLVNGGLDVAIDSYRRSRESSFEVWPGIDANCCYLGECQLHFNNRVVEMSSYGLVVGRLSAVVVSLSRCFSVARCNNHTVTSVAKTSAADGYHLEDLRWAELPMNGPKSPQRLSFVHLLRVTPLLASLLLWLVRWAWHKAQVETCS